MACRDNSKRAHSRQGLKEDRISQLHDALICQILSHLQFTKEVVKTSVLSTRWRSLWLEVPMLDLNPQYFRDFNVFKSFGDRVFDSNNMSCIHKLRLVYFKDKNGEQVNVSSYLTSWIDAATKRKLQHLETFFRSDDQICEIPISLYTCKTLVSLKLDKVVMPDAGFVSLPCLKTMDLMDLRYHDDSIFERLVSCSPVLEELKIVDYEDLPKVFRVYSLSLKKLQAALLEGQVVIDAPLLRVLKIQDNDPGSYIVKKLDSNFKLDISLCFEELDDPNSIRDFLPGISKVGEMNMCADTFKLFHHNSKLRPLPQFVYMSRLDVMILISDLKWLPTFLGCCPNLQSLVMGLEYRVSADYHSEEVKQFSFSSVQECSLSSLEYVVFKYFFGSTADIELVRYFLENSIILKKLTLELRDCKNENAMFTKLLEIPRRSITCQVIVREREKHVKRRWIRNI